MMLNTFSTYNFLSLCDGLAGADADLAAIIEAHGYPPMWNRPNTFETLVHIILEQQVSLASALAALNKLREFIGEVTPEAALALSDEEWRACYFSRQKMGYVKYLAAELLSGELDLPGMGILPDEEVRARLTALKGIGNWTVDVYLIFVLQRADVFPMGDLAAVNALKRVKGFPRETHRDELLPVVEGWRPYRTIATMLLWHYYLS
ncbi:DNA-3-methyladenine glycosylase family protein [Puia dinghuensis]|uniref:DNA-3-methyladenine glycosylase II n=1 Tax=Puia dinghuensis TaxID=1792502 RepID=A0A8J2UD49_9BACT|nr:DNA-3-methyladenine glycosylase 2 family protein [Puia dinghuensis]GGA98335.1 3-methyladenine DNA glycosylase [Puia dinghuensis]